MRKGRFELADGGTLLLDEISEIAPEIQAKLLRVLQERTFERVGSSTARSVDVRIIATSNRDLEAAVASGDFRQDLFFRLNVVPVHVPPLRDRAGDILFLAEKFRKLFVRKHGVGSASFSEESQKRMADHDFPGNVRELQNVVERAVILDGVEIGAGAELYNVIIDKNVKVPPGYQIGVDAAHDRERFADNPGCLVTDEGLVVIGKNEELPT